MRNFATAKHRDATRFHRVRTGEWVKEKVGLRAGEFFMVKRKKEGTLDVNARPTMLRVVRVKEKGVVVLQGQDGACIEEEEKNVSP